MSTHTDQVWLTENAHDRLKRELGALLAQRENGAAGTTDVTEQEQREVRIRQLQERTRNAVCTNRPTTASSNPAWY